MQYVNISMNGTTRIILDDWIMEAIEIQYEATQIAERRSW